ncbi:MAG: hypothetical protein QF410_15035 [Planctomycetota bacterium]|jgi:hypothetical protein|nr:hypothetical protein [Planctomycetota bacterium]MDP6409415.1 hypothetical protein [Planctomycetota bacterium]MDP6540857.1 hypothetical protein [Planctomycetota bacterium]
MTWGIVPLLIAAVLLLGALIVGGLLIVLGSRRRTGDSRPSHRLAKGLLALAAMVAGALAVLRSAPVVELVELRLETEPGLPAEVWIDGLLQGHAPLTLTTEDLRPLLVPIDEMEPLIAADRIGRHHCPGRRCPNVIGMRYNFHSVPVERPDGSQDWVIHKNDLAGGRTAALRVELRDAQTGETIPFRRDEWARDRILNVHRYEHTFLFGPSRRIDFDAR